VFIVLSDELVSDWLENDWLVELCANKVPWSRLKRLSLAVNNLPLCLGVFLELLIGLNPVKKLLTTTRVLHMLDTDVNTLCKNALLDTLVDNDTERMLCHIINNTCASMITLVWHSLLNRTITPDINNVSLFIGFHVR